MSCCCRKGTCLWGSWHSPGLPGMTREVGLLPQCHPFLPPPPQPWVLPQTGARTNTSCFPSMSPPACGQPIGWKNQTLPHVRETSSGYVPIQPSPTHQGFLEPAFDQTQSTSLGVCLAWVQILTPPMPHCMPQPIGRLSCSRLI